MNELQIFLERKIAHIDYLIKCAEMAGITVHIKVPNSLNSKGKTI